MPEYRRSDQPGGAFFFTIVTNLRQPLLRQPRQVQHLRAALRQVLRERPFKIWASVILPDHMHFLWELPRGDNDFSARIGRMKILFTKSIAQSPADLLPLSRLKHRESSNWQRRFWEHTIRDEDDFQNHFDYIHYNPVKYGLAACPHEWPYSSFHYWQQRGEYDRAWCCSCSGSTPKVPDFSRLERTVGE